MTAVTTHEMHPASDTCFGEEELAIYRDSVGRFLDEHAPPERIETWRDNKVVDRSAWLDAGAFGLLGASVPAEYGGLGGDFRHERIIIEEFGKRGLEGWAVPLHNMIVAPYIVALDRKSTRLNSSH